MKYLTTLEVAHELKVSKQTLLNWLYAGKIPEPPRNRKGYRLWSRSRISLIKKLIMEGRLPRRSSTGSVQPPRGGDRVRARGQPVPARRKLDVESFLRELGRLNAGCNAYFAVPPRAHAAPRRLEGRSRPMRSGWRGPPPRHRLPRPGRLDTALDAVISMDATGRSPSGTPAPSRFGVARRGDLPSAGRADRAPALRSAHRGARAPPRTQDASSTGWWS